MRFQNSFIIWFWKGLKHNIQSLVMKLQSTIAIALFFAGFFAKDVIDDIFFLMIDKYPIEVFGFTISATAYKTMLVISSIY